MRVLLTGAAGFVGSQMLRVVQARRPDWRLVCPLSLRHHGNSDRLTGLDLSRVEFVHTDLAWGIPETAAGRYDGIDLILSIGSNSGVEESITDPVTCVRNNVELQMNVLELARRVRPGLVLHMGTDEEYGPAADGYAHREWDAIVPSNPYSASKAAQAALATAYWRTYGVPVVFTRTMNLIGPAQSREKLVPTVIRKVLAGETVPIYAEDGRVGSRCWIDVADFCDAWLYLADQPPAMWPKAGRPDMWHIVGPELTNLRLAGLIAEALGRPLKYELIETYAVRPGHDLRYALDGSKLAPYWAPKTPIEETVRRTVDWYLNHREWL